MSDISKIRYYFEHQFLPDVFYREDMILPVDIKKNPDVLRQNWKLILNKYQIDDPYDETAWQVEGFEIDPHHACMRIVCPKPEKEPQCYWIYLFFRYDMTLKYYMTAERGGLFQEEAFLCGWDRNHNHKNFGGCSMDKEKATDEAIAVFRKLTGEIPQNSAA